MFYAAENSYATDTSIGFANTWYVIAFEDRASRDEYVRTAPSFAARAITKKEVPQYTSDRPKPFSGAYFGIANFTPWETHPAGFVGTVEVCSPHEYGMVRRLYS